MKTKFKIILLSSIAVAFVLVGLTKSASANQMDAGPKQLEACTKTQGRVVVMLGNVCKPSGEGCQPNPCD